MSNDTLHVKPAQGLIVRDPVTAKALTAKGARVPNTSYWRRRLAVGDVLSVPAARKAASKDTQSEA